MTRSSLQPLMDVHEDLHELWDGHRDLVVLRRFADALRVLDAFGRALRLHMRDEERRVFPLYEQRVVPVPGGDPQFFRLEHRNLLRNLALLRRRLRALALTRSRDVRRAHQFLQSESLFLQILEHHDRRERNILYPQLEKNLSRQEATDLLRQCRLRPDQTLSVKSR